MRFKKNTNLLREIGELLPHDIQQVKKDFRKNIKALFLSRMESFPVVMKSELSTQRRLLSKSRQILEDLENRVTVLEKAQEVRKQ